MEEFLAGLGEKFTAAAGTYLDTLAVREAGGQTVEQVDPNVIKPAAPQQTQQVMPKPQTKIAGLSIPALALIAGLVLLVVKVAD